MASNVAFLVLSLGAEGIDDKGERDPAQAAGPFSVSAVALAGFPEAALLPIRPGAEVNVFPRIASGRFGDARFSRIGLAGVNLWVEIEGWDGRTHRVQWPLTAN